ncbi:MAG: lysylphosphatidylglycerol synthase transmembrane domain-containing protein [Thermoplasmatota archaeon]
MTREPAPRDPQAKAWTRLIPLLAGIAAFVVYAAVLAARGEWGRVGASFHGAVPWLLVVMLVLSALGVVVDATLSWMALACVSTARVRPGKLLVISLAAAFVNFLPTLGFGGSALKVYAFARAKVRWGRALSSTFVILVSQYFGYAAWALVGAAALSALDQPRTYALGLVIALALSVAPVVFVILLATGRAHSVDRFLRKLARRLRVEHDPRFSRGAEVRAGLKRYGVLALALGAASTAVDVALLAVAFSALGTPIAFQPLIAAYAVAAVAGRVIPIFPSGIGLAEASLDGALLSFGAPGATVIAATLLYRAVAVYIPALIGTVAYLAIFRAGWVPRAAGKVAPQQG